MPIPLLIRFYCHLMVKSLSSHKNAVLLLLLTVCLQVPDGQAQPPMAVFNVKTYGASGQKTDNALPAIQKAIDAAAVAGGGTVYFPAGEYTTATLVLASNIRLHLEGGATLYASQDPEAYAFTKGMISNETNTPVLLYGNGLKNIAFSGTGTIDGQARHVWEDLKEVDGFIKAETENARASGTEMKRAYALDPKVSLFFLLDCENVNIQDITILNSPTWALHLQWCKDVQIKGIRLYSSLDKGVNSDGIDIDGCRDVVISDCIIETGDDAICLKSTNRNGRFEPVENLSVTNCVLASTSTALKIGTETWGDFRNIVFNNCAIKNTNRGLGIFVRDGATVENVIFSNITLETNRKHFNWWGDGDAFRMVVLKRNESSKVGRIRNILITNIIAHGQGTSLAEGFEGQNLENITVSNVKLFMHPEGLADKRATNAFTFNRVSNLKLHNIEVQWDTTQPEQKWQHALLLRNINGLEVDRFTGRQGLLASSAPALRLENSSDATLTHLQAAEGTGTLLQVSGQKSRDIQVQHLDVKNRSARPLEIKDAPKQAVKRIRSKG
jgi:hypothetical protein